MKKCRQIITMAKTANKVLSILLSLLLVFTLMPLAFAEGGELITVATSPSGLPNRAYYFDFDSADTGELWELIRNRRYNEASYYFSGYTPDDCTNYANESLARDKAQFKAATWYIDPETNDLSVDFVGGYDPYVVFSVTDLNSVNAIMKCLRMVGLNSVNWIKVSETKEGLDEGAYYLDTDEIYEREYRYTEALLNYYMPDMDPEDVAAECAEAAEEEVAKITANNIYVDPDGVFFRVKAVSKDTGEVEYWPHVEMCGFPWFSTDYDSIIKVYTTYEDVTYIDENGEEKTVRAKIIDKGAYYGEAGTTGWYVLKGTQSFDRIIGLLDAQSNIILADGSDTAITETGSFNLLSLFGSVSIYRQAEGTGKLTLYNRLYTGSGNVTVNGGNIEAPGIQTNMSDGTFTINGGVVKADGIYAKNVTVNGGSLEALPVNVSGEIKVTGGTFTAKDPTTVGIEGGSIEITGGTVNAEGQAGLYSQGPVTITGGTVNATANGNNRGMGIFGKTVAITGGKVTAVSNSLFGLYASESITLGADEPDTSITVSSVFPDVGVTVKDCQVLTDGERNYSGALSDEDKAALANKTLTLLSAHDYGQWIEETAATCVDDGVLGHYECSSCGGYFDAEFNEMDAIVIPATGIHTPGEGVVENEVPATCGEEGSFDSVVRCRDCSAELSREKVIVPATGDHVTEIVNAKAATATEEGYTGDEVCTVCGQTIKQGEVIPATGDTTPDEPDDGDACPYCGKVHTGRHAKWIKIVHLVFAFLLDVFRIIKK